MKADGRAQALPVEMAKTAILTCHGSAGAVPFMKTVRSEGSKEYAKALRDNLTPSQRRQVEHAKDLGLGGSW